jgi:ribose 1,5-bisphosphate isomerase
MDKQLLRTYNDIKSIKIQGATKIALAVAEALLKYAKTLKVKNSAALIREMKSAGKYLLTARSTEPMADNVVEFVVYYLKQNKDLPIVELKKVLADAIYYFLELSRKNDEAIVKFGTQVIASGDKVFTHCHSGTVVKIFVGAKKNKKKFQVFQSETRPLYQGHKTAVNLVKAKIKDTLVVDSSAASIIVGLADPKVKINKVIIGCDSISRDGSCVNKVGSYAIALAAKQKNIPVYIATQTLKMNEDAKNLKMIKIEEREAREVWDKAPKGLKIFNPAFDRIPSELITGFITEFGVIEPKKMFEKVKAEYKFVI